MNKKTNKQKKIQLNLKSNNYRLKTDRSALLGYVADQEKEENVIP